MSVKQRRRRMVFFGSREALMATLHGGNLESFIKQLR